MRAAAVETKLGVLKLDEVADPVLTVNLAVHPQMGVRTDFDLVMNDAVGNARAVDRAVLSDHGVNQKRLRKDCRPVVDHSVAFQIDVRIQCDVFAQDDVRSDIRAVRIDQRDAFLHPMFVDPLLHPAGCLRQFFFVVDAAGFKAVLDNLGLHA